MKILAAEFKSFLVGGENTATISNCSKYRFTLSRIWDYNLPTVLFILHNPSTGTADKDDRTIRRCMDFAKAWGYGGLYIGNLSPYRATDPEDLANVPYDELMPEDNAEYLEQMIAKCSIIVLAYGNVKYIFGFMAMINKIKSRAHYLKLNASGHPAHPLYLRGNLKPIPYPQV